MMRNPQSPKQRTANAGSLLHRRPVSQHHQMHGRPFEHLLNRTKLDVRVRDVEPVEEGVVRVFKWTWRCGRWIADKKIRGREAADSGM